MTSPLTQKQYSLVTTPRHLSEQRLSLYSRPLKRTGEAEVPESKPELEGYLKSLALKVCRSCITDILRKAELNFSSFDIDERLDISEDLGLFFSLAFRVIQPINDAVLARRLLNELDAMASDEIKYWLGKLNGDSRGHDFRVFRALRMLLEADRVGKTQTENGIAKCRLLKIRETFDLTFTEFSYLLEVPKNVVVDWLDPSCPALPGEDKAPLIEYLSQIADRVQSLNIARFENLARRDLFWGESLLVLIRNGEPIGKVDDAIEIIKAISEKEAQARRLVEGSGINLRNLEDVMERGS